MFTTKSFLLVVFFVLVLLDLAHAIRPIVHKRRHRSSHKRPVTDQDTVRRLPRVWHISSRHHVGTHGKLNRLTSSTMVTITSSNINSGTGTFFANGLGACGPTNSGAELVVALSRDLFAALADSKASSACGRRILATGPKGVITVTVSDQCETCDKFDLDFSQGAFTRIADPAAGRVPIEWSFLD